MIVRAQEPGFGQERAPPAGAMRLLFGASAGDVMPEDRTGGPIPAIKLALKKDGLTLDQIDASESNEAFAA